MKYFQTVLPIFIFSVCVCLKKMPFSTDYWMLRTRDSLSQSHLQTVGTTFPYFSFKNKDENTEH